MRLIISKRGKARLPGPRTRRLLRKAAFLSLLRVGAPTGQEISLVLTDDAEITKLNRKYRGLGKATDVLSFRMDGPGAKSGGHGGGRPLLGDIVISLERAVAQAAEYGHGFERELVFLTVHGMLHLLGLDHEQKSERTRMEKYQRQILRVMEITG